MKIGEISPDFEAKSIEEMIHFYNWLGDNWCLFLIFPTTFTPVCRTELARMVNLRQEFEMRKVKTIALRGKSHCENENIVSDFADDQNYEINFPLIADDQNKLSLLYDLTFEPNTKNLVSRDVFIIDPQKEIRLILNYPISTGRNFYELLRIIDSLQLSGKDRFSTPADWRFGEDVFDC